MEETFCKINALYAEYEKVSVMENTESRQLKIKQQIMETVWKSKRKYYEENDCALEVTNAVISCLKSFPKSAARENGGQFSAYLYDSLKRAVGTSREKEELADKNAGNKTSDYLVRQIHKLKKFRKEHPDLDNESLVKEASRELNIKESKIRNILKIISASTSGTEQTNEEGEEFANPDIQEFDDSNPLESWLIGKERRELILQKSKEEWEKKKPDAMLSELLTVTFLECGFGFEKLNKYDFIDKKILNAFFDGKNGCELPQGNEIAGKYGTTKSAASKKLYRFLESVKESMNK